MLSTRSFQLQIRSKHSIFWKKWRNKLIMRRKFSKLKQKESDESRDCSFKTGEQNVTSSDSECSDDCTKSSDSDTGFDFKLEQWDPSGGTAIWNISSEAEEVDTATEWNGTKKTHEKQKKVKTESEQQETDLEGSAEWEAFKRSSRSKSWATKEAMADMKSFIDRENYRYISPFIEHLVFDKYLKCKVQPWKYPKSSKDKVEIELIPSPFLPPLNKRPMIIKLPGSKTRHSTEFRRVCGYREIFLKRQYIEYLKDVEAEAVRKIPEVKKGSDLKLRFHRVAPGGVGMENNGSKRSIKAKNPSLKTKSIKNLRNTSLIKGSNRLPSVKLNINRNKNPPLSQSSYHGALGAINHKNRLDIIESAPVILGEFKQHQGYSGGGFQRYEKQKFRGKVDNLGMYIGPEIPDRDSEWLALSDSMDEEKERELKTLDKKHEKWMHPDLSYESQSLVKSMSLLMNIFLFGGRKFLFASGNEIKGHIEFKVIRKKMIFFVITSFILWISLGVIIQSVFDIKSSIDNKDPEVDEEQQEGSYVDLEALELGKYFVPFVAFFAYLFIISLWSIFVILRDGTVISHYLNCWVGALVEMETSSALEIKKTTIHNIIFYMVYALTVTIAFITNWPANVRGTCGIVSMLMFRPFILQLRTLPEEQLLHFQIFGLVLILYVMYCSRCLFAFMQVVSLILRNTVETWNFKFALRFHQLMITDSGQMMNLFLNHNLTKLFAHHRLITALLKIYGMVFVVPVMSYMIAQIAVVTNCFVWLFRFKEGAIEDYDGRSSLNISLVNGGTLDVPFYHSAAEEIATTIFTLGYSALDFLYTTEVIATAGESFFDGYEFVRRTNLILCETSHERRLMQSLLWSFSSTEPSILSANSFFPINRQTIFAAAGTAVFFCSMIIQLQSNENRPVINIPLGCNSDSCTEVDKEGNNQPIIKPLDPSVLKPPGKVFYLFEDCLKLNGSHSISFIDVSDNDNVCSNEDKNRINSYDRFIPEDWFMEYQKIWNADWTAPDPLSDNPKGSCSSNSPPYINSKKQQCGWMQYYRDCFTKCYSNILKKYLIIPIVLKSSKSGAFVPYFNYQKIENQLGTWDSDCGVNPYANEKGTEDMYDCFQKKIDKDSLDICGWLNFYEPTNFTRTVNDDTFLFNNNWKFSEDRYPLSNRIPVDLDGLPLLGEIRCHSSELAFVRCKSHPEYCPLAKLDGVPDFGHWYGNECYLYAWTEPDITGFCPKSVVLIKEIKTNAKPLELGKAISVKSFEDRLPHFNKAFDTPPCRQTTEINDMTHLEWRLFYQFICIKTEAKTGKKIIIQNHRPYYLTKDKLWKQIPLDLVFSNNASCVTGNPYNDLPFNFTDGIENYTVTTFFGCGGYPLINNCYKRCNDKLTPYPPDVERLLNSYCEKNRLDKEPCIITTNPALLSLPTSPLPTCPPI